MWTVKVPLCTTQSPFFSFRLSFLQSLMVIITIIWPKLYFHVQTQFAVSICIVAMQQQASGTAAAVWPNNTSLRKNVHVLRINTHGRVRFPPASKRYFFFLFFSFPTFFIYSRPLIGGRESDFTAFCAKRYFLSNAIYSYGWSNAKLTSFNEHTWKRKYKPV